MVIFDKFGPRSNIYQTAADNQVAFIQIRNNRPLQAMYEYLSGLVEKTPHQPPADQDAIRTDLWALPDELFISGLLPSSEDTAT